MTEQNRHGRNRKGFVLLSGLMLVVFLTILLGVALMRSNIQFKMTNQRRAIHEAFYTAEASIERAIFELRRNPHWSPGKNGQPPEQNVRLNRVPGDDATTSGFYSLEVADGGIFKGWNTAWIRSVGKDSLQSITKVIVTRVIVESPTRFLISTLGDLRVGSGASVEADVLAQNIFFDVNPSLPSPQKDITVDGDVFYIRSINGQNDPAVHFQSSSQIQQSPSITFAGVDLNRYRGLAQNNNQGYYQNGDLTVDLDNLSNLSPGQAFAPQIIFAEGNVHISGEYDHSLLVVAGGDVFIEGDITPVKSLPVRPQIGILAKKDLIIPSNALDGDQDMNLEAFLMADGDGAAEGRFVAQGQKFSWGTLNFTGAMSIRGEGRTAVDLNAFDKRIYRLNPELNINRQIPFVPFIVNVIEWNEKRLQDPFPPL